MRTASLVLGIIGGVLAIIFALIFIVGGMAVNALGNNWDQLTQDLQSQGWTVEDNGVQQAAGYAGASLWIIGILSIVGGVLGIVGGAMAKKKNIVAGILLIIAAIPSFFTGLGIIASILFIVGGVLAFIPEKPAQPTAAA